MPIAEFLRKPRILWESSQGYTKVESFFDGTSRFAYIRQFDDGPEGVATKDTACICMSQQDLMEIILAMSIDARRSQKAKNEADKGLPF